MSPLASTKPTPSVVLKIVARRVTTWLREPVPQRSTYVGHSGGWGHHGETVARW